MRNIIGDIFDFVLGIVFMFVWFFIIIIGFTPLWVLVWLIWKMTK